MTELADRLNSVLLIRDDIPLTVESLMDEAAEALREADALRAKVRAGLDTTLSHMSHHEWPEAVNRIVALREAVE